MYDDIIFAPRQHEALTAMFGNQNVFLTGNAGTGKSGLIKYFLYHTNKNVICLAPTGFAARNLPDAMTIHSFFRFPIEKVLLRGCDIDFHSEVVSLLQNVNTIIIDEISMVRSDIFYGVDQVLRLGGNPNYPFGGKQIIVVGDFYQLPPVISDRVIGDALEEHFEGIYAFNTPSWKAANFHNIYLNKIYRQNDPEYIEFLNAIRTQKNEVGALLKKYNLRLINPDACDQLCLCSRLKEAEEINNREIDKLFGRGMPCTGKISGVFPESDLPVPKNMTIKLNTKMMVICNYKNQHIHPSEYYEYVNGEIGYVTGINPEYKIISLKMMTGKRIRVGMSRWSNFVYKRDIDENGNTIIRPEEIGRFWQYPLIPAWAISIHKAQGQTLNKMNLRLGVSQCFAPGQLYTALSRIKTSNDLTIDRPLDINDVLIDRQVMDFYERTFPEENF